MRVERSESIGDPGDEPIVGIDEGFPNVAFASVVDPDPVTLYS